jgi:Protein of unknown function (DUF559)
VEPSRPSGDVAEGARTRQKGATSVSSFDWPAKTVIGRCHAQLMTDPLKNTAALPSGLLLRSELLSQGYTASVIRHRLASGVWARECDGVYIDLTVGTAQQIIARNAARLKLCGPEAMISHETAAIHHGFDSTRGWDTQTVSISQTMGKRPPKQEGFRFFRSRTLAYDQPVESNGLRYTSRARTLIDVLATLDLIEGERVLESALRGLDPKRPDVWCEDVLEQLNCWIRDHPRQPGVQRARVLLAQRPIGCRPTGSIAETAAFQALRKAGFTEIIRQPHVKAPDEHGNPRDHFLDGLLLPHMFDIEVDGGDHDDPKRRAADLKRDRRLAGAFVVLRFTASEALFTPNVVVNAVREEIQRRAHEATFQRNSPGLIVTGGGLSWNVRADPDLKIAG